MPSSAPQARHWVAAAILRARRRADEAKAEELTLASLLIRVIVVVLVLPHVLGDRREARVMASAMHPDPRAAVNISSVSAR